jgi:hypothetical protein
MHLLTSLDALFVESRLRDERYSRLHYRPRYGHFLGKARDGAGLTVKRRY